MSWTLTKKLDAFAGPEERSELDSHEEVRLSFAGPGEIKRREVSWTLTKKLDAFAGPGEIKRREVSWTLKLAQKRSRAGRWSWATQRELDFFSFSCFPTAELRTLSLFLHSSWDSNCVVRWSLRNAGRTLP